MTNAAFGKKTLAIAVMASLCAALIAVPAYGFYHVHNEDAGNADGQGVIEVVCTVDETAQGGTIRTDLMFLPEGSTADAVLAEAVVSSENQTGLDAIHNYDVTTLGDYLQGKNYTYTVAVYPTGEVQAYKDAEGAYAATSQNVSEAYTAKGDGSTVVDRYDNVVITVTQ